MSKTIIVLAIVFNSVSASTSFTATLPLSVAKSTKLEVDAAEKTLTFPKYHADDPLVEIYRWFGKVTKTKCSKTKDTSCAI